MPPIPAPFTRTSATVRLPAPGAARRPGRRGQPRQDRAARRTARQGPAPVARQGAVLWVTTAGLVSRTAEELARFVRDLTVATVFDPAQRRRSSSTRSTWRTST